MFYDPEKHDRRPNSLGAVIGSFKSADTRTVNRPRPGAGEGLWQSGDCEHVVRRQHGLEAIRACVRQNPARWPDDAEHPAGTGGDRFEQFVRSVDRSSSDEKGDAGVAPTGGVHD